jgi:signal transduction histidine kinase
VISDIGQILQVQKAIGQKLEAIEVLVLLRRVEQELLNEREAARVDINIQVSPNLTIFGIRPYVHSVFYNLMSNAFKYIDRARKGRLDIKAEEEYGKIKITFTDNGLGFDSESQKEKIFKPFSRLSLKGEGKGLGLFLVKIQMDAMNGVVEISSLPNVGTSVSLYFAIPPKNS